MNEPIKLKRTLSLPIITFYGLGTILGAGIYVLVGKVAASAGLYAPIAFFVASVIAGFTAFAYAELSSRFPKSAGEAVYVREALQIHWLAGVVGWMVVVVGIVSSATIANGFVGYLNLFINIPEWLVIALLILTLGTLAFWGVKQSALVVTLMTLLEIAGLILVVAVAGDNLLQLPERLPELIPPLEAGAFTGILLGAFLAFYAFIGFEDMVNMAEEVHEPRKNLPTAIILALTAATILYFLIALVAVLSLPILDLAGSEAPLAAIVESAGYSPHLIALISMTAVVNGALVQMIMASRVLYGMAAQGNAPILFNKVHPKTQTPHLATLFVTAFILIFALWLPLKTLAETTSFITLLIFTLVNLALIVMKHREPHPEHVVTYPLWLPIVGLGLCLFILLFQTFQMLF